MKFENQVEKIKQMVNEAKTIALVGHRNPDGDCIGCCAAMAEWLESKGKVVSIFVDGELSEKFSYIRKLNMFIEIFIYCFYRKIYFTQQKLENIFI